MVEIRDKDGENEVEYLPLNGMWTVQDRTSKKSKRFAFEVSKHHTLREFSVVFGCESVYVRV